MKKQREMEVWVRAVRKEDLDDVNAMRCMKEVRGCTTGLISERLSQTEQWINNLSNNDHVLVAEANIDGKKGVVGYVCLNSKNGSRFRHVGNLWIMVHPDFQSRGIGRKLMEHILELADNWLNIIRVELTVTTKNEKALKLYQSLGFVIEGTSKYAFFADGDYQDLHIMARYRVPVSAKG